MNLPTLLTWVRVVGVVALAVLLTSFDGVRGWALLVFVVAAVTDFLDGYLARAWNQTTPFGRMLDSIADKLLVGVTLLVLCAEGTITGVNALAAALILMREIAISGLREHLGEKGVVIPASMAGKWKTTVQLVALAALIAAPLTPFPQVSLWAGLILLWGASALTIWSGWEYAWGARGAFGRPVADPIPTEEPAPGQSLRPKEGL
jgi:CDP-diacylglycerol--glycerol-3-phosphate 3-phosphatidyltransferase